MPRSLIVLLLLASCGKADRAPKRAPARSDASVDLAVPPGPPAYGSFEEVVRAGSAAIGKTALLELRRLVVRPDQLVAEPCSGGSGNLIFVGFKPGERDLARGLPFAEKACGKVLVKVSLVDVPGFYSSPGPDGGLVIASRSGMLVEGYALAFPDVVARPAPSPPPGADFGDVDEIGFAGEHAEGKTALIEGRLELDLGRIFFWPCDGHSDSVILDGPKDAAPAEKRGTCRPVRFRVHYSSVLLDPKQYRFGGTLTE